MHILLFAAVIYDWVKHFAIIVGYSSNFESTDGIIIASHLTATMPMGKNKLNLTITCAEPTQDSAE